MKEVILRLKKWRVTLILGFLALAINLFSYQSGWVEEYYSAGIYPYIGASMRRIFGWLPFSLGDILYALVVGWLIFLLFRLVRNIFQQKLKAGPIVPVFIKMINGLLLIYIYFNLSWGLNYNRLGISYQLGLNVTEQPASKLIDLTDRLIIKTNSYAAVAGRNTAVPSGNVLSASVKNYDKLSKDYPFLVYQPRSVKRSLFGVLGNYMGYTGYYNPFTAEAQINDAVPGFLHPFVASHEIAHQLGYAKENEANFVGFLAARVSDDSAFKYSAYFEMFLYANSELFRRDSLLARKNIKKLAPEVQRDLAELRAYRLRYENPLDKLISIFYDRYLKLNQQPDGDRTYSKVVLWLLAYYDKFDEI
jgi:Protein of unknown function (DUF3810)